MSAAHDRQFIDLFTLVVGVLVGIAVGIYFLSNSLGGGQNVEIRGDERYLAEVDERIAPVGKVAVAGQDNSALNPLSTAAAAPAALAVSSVVMGGEEVYNAACVVCHGAGVAGAPKFGDRAAWATHLAKGDEVLRRSAIQGIQGPNGIMPPKGGRTDLADQSIINGVDYMLNAVR